MYSWRLPLYNTFSSLLRPALNYLDERENEAGSSVTIIKNVNFTSENKIQIGPYRRNNIHNEKCVQLFTVSYAARWEVINAED